MNNTTHGIDAESFTEAVAILKAQVNFKFAKVHREDSEAICYSMPGDMVQVVGTMTPTTLEMLTIPAQKGTE